MSPRTLYLSILVVACLVVAVLPVQADSNDGSTVKVIYQTAFSSDPHWTTNSPSSDYWDPSSGRYHFSIEPSTGNYAYTPIDNMEGPFTFEYDVVFDRVDDGSAFRFGVTGAEMDFNKGPNVITMFSNGKHDNIMSLHIVTTGAKQMEVNSQSDDELTSGPTGVYKGSTVHFELNKTYHVRVDYVDAATQTTMRVSEKTSGKEIWSYFINTVENLRNMNHIYLGSRGDYGNMNIHASGYIDNLRLSQPGPAITPEQTFGAIETTVPAATITTKKPMVLPTPLPPDVTTQSPLSPLLVILALGILGTAGALRGMKKY